MDISRQMPYSIDSEQSVLGSVIIDPIKLDNVVSYLKGEYFYIPQHKEIFEIMLSMHSMNQKIDFVTLLNQVIEKKIYDSDTDAKSYLLSLAEIVPTSAHIDEYAKIVCEKAVLRQLIESCDKINELCYEQTESAEKIVDYAESLIYDLSQDRVGDGFSSLYGEVKLSIERLKNLQGPDREQYLGIPTGFTDLDTILGGLNRSDLILLAARPGMGKTSFVLNIAQNIAFTTKKEVAIFSLEMSNGQLTDRFISSEAQIDSKRLRTGELTNSDWEKIALATNVLHATPVLMSDLANSTVNQMKAKLRKLKNLGVVIIDYIQLMSGSTKTDNRQQEVSDISRSLKLMAKELNVPVLVCSQLSRGPESRTNKRPMLSDLRESGAIEQDADIVMFLYRDDYYNPASEEKNISECIVAKNRHGETDTIKLQWNGQFTRFSNLEKNRDEY